MDFHEQYLGELKRLERESIGKAEKAKIIEFLTHIQNREELSERRLYWYSEKLRTIARILGDRFLEPTDKDIEQVLGELKNRTARGDRLSEWTIEGYKITLRKYYRWAGKKESVDWIKRNNNPNYKKKPDFTISQEEVDILISACDNARDKAIFSLLYDTGIRLGEMLSLRIKDLTFDDYGMRLLVTGKTGSRIVRAIGDSVGYTRSWLNVHPDQFNEDAWLFCGIGHDMRGKVKIGEAMNYSQIYMAFKKIKNRAINMGFPRGKRINPHKFRHNRASQLAPKISESILERQMGWIPSSRMTRIYVHLNDEETDYAILEAQGLKPERKPADTRKARICLNCKTPNPEKSKFCMQCGRPLDFSEARILEERSSEITNSLISGNLISDTEKAMLENISPDARNEILLVILKSLKESGKLGDLAKGIKK